MSPDYFAPKMASGLVIKAHVKVVRGSLPAPRAFAASVGSLRFRRVSAGRAGWAWESGDDSSAGGAGLRRRLPRYRCFSDRARRARSWLRGRAQSLPPGRDRDRPHTTAVMLARQRGLTASTPSEFLDSAHALLESIDILLVTHVLEHLDAAEAEALLRAYLPFVRPSGRPAVRPCGADHYSRARFGAPTRLMCAG